MPLRQPEAAKPAPPSQPSVLPRPCPCCGGRKIIIETFARQPKHQPTPAPVAIRTVTSTTTPAGAASTRHELVRMDQEFRRVMSEALRQDRERAGSTRR